VKTFENIYQHEMYFFENKIDWHLVYEDDAYSVY